MSTFLTMRNPTANTTPASRISPPVDPTYAQSAERICAVIRTFCQAIEAGDFATMQPLWERTRRVMCSLPGRPIRRGWPAVALEWIEALESPVDIVVSNLSVSIEGSMAWAMYDCDRLPNHATTTPNVPILGVHTTAFAFSNDSWKIITHHASSRVAATSAF